MAARHKPQGRGIKQVVVRFNLEQDAALLEWLAPFAASYDMTKVIRLACYLLAGLEPEEGLLALLPAIQRQQGGASPRATRPRTSQPASSALADVMQELAALRAAVMDQQASTAERSAPEPHSWAQEYREIDPGPIAGVVASSGLDMSARRRRTPAPRLDAGAPAPPVREFDAEASSRLLVKTIREFSSNLQRGR